MNNYPTWICAECGQRYGRFTTHYSTFHEGDICGWCSRSIPTTEPRDYGYPAYPGIELMPADPEGWWAMFPESLDPTEWVWGETPMEALEGFLNSTRVTV